ncbi:GNAT family N-acetyltransferase [Fictibacillus barbaricus]|uniref:GNAT family N-acyltransferase n=1 Tax=Fictibacillus barbaricus TaxID=182136 RepID=A0ABU1TXW1_9BACL|nr:GNAT family N-acetyltransferase [Fictibacillus barbaricus]MDR7072062.1 putative GNAT family N-acyltransferase [Fictibacillus barbaricus]
MIKKYSTEDKGYKDALHVRRDVFVHEQQIDESEEIDDYEDSSLHFVLYDEEKPVGASRLRQVNKDGKVERVCILSSHRKKGLGEKLMRAMEQTAIDQSFSSLILYAQIQAEDFYKKLGYETTSTEPFLDANIPHVAMKKVLKSS